MLRVMRKSRILRKNREKLLHNFVVGSTSRVSSRLVGINPNSGAYYFRRIRDIIALHMDAESSLEFDGEVELDESYFGGHRKGKRGRGAAGKVVVFGILMRGGRVYTTVIPSARRDVIMPIVTDKVVSHSVIYTDSLGVYDSLDVSSFPHRRVNHSVEFARGKDHVNGIENFWDRAKRHLRKFNGIPRQYFYLYLKECEWRFNYADPTVKLDMLRKWLLDND